ncbi:family 78 glycoside hydrolase catalytic domain [Paenibacillus sp. GCM10027626]|uniref:family 78 glycoside hydrolase catalytic domain n=1 Tax=Paenibacillus sp. GCM10027626 TaxID=3273411 RepID=UPI00364050FF
MRLKDNPNLNEKTWGAETNDFGIMELRVEYRNNPIGIGVRVPRFSWKLFGSGRGIRQEGYRIQISEDDPQFQNPIWDSGDVNSDQSVHIEYEGSSLKSRQVYFCRVFAWDTKGRVSDWQNTFFETGILDFREWTAQWITFDPEKHDRPAETLPLFRKTFESNSRLRSARIYATALGLYELELNGRRLNDQLFTPGWTSYHKRLQTQTFDVTEYIRFGGNAIGITVADGWYKGRIGGHPRDFYGNRRAALLELHLTYEDGSEQRVVTDGSWRAETGPIVMASLYDGETYDARLEKEGWSLPKYDDQTWLPVETMARSNHMLIPQENVPTVIVRELKPERALRLPSGETILDFGQNLTGWVSYAVTGERGTVIELTHAEVLDSDGNLYIENLRSAKQKTSYICKGTGNERYEPRFSFQGFRYAKVNGYPGDVNPEWFTAHVISSDLEETGTFECSDPLVNQLQSNIVWGQRGNFLDVPTDCPQRDERLGYTGDAQVFVRTAAHNMNVAVFFTKWLKDLKADQLPNGGVPHTIPDTLPGWEMHSASGWGDAAVICPWTIYLCYGDLRLLEEQYDSMKAWVEFLRNSGEQEFLRNGGFQFGDWLALDAPAGTYTGATPKDFIATAFYAHSANLLAKSARALGKEEDAAKYEELFGNIRDRFNKEFVTSAGRLVSPTQTAHVLALHFGLVEGAFRKRVEKSFIQLIEESEYKPTTGFLGTPYICPVLSSIGRSDLAYRLVLSHDYPSWLYPVKQGATTIWEHWDGQKPDGSFWSPEMNSFNHYAFGAIGEWLYRYVAGIDTDEAGPGFKHIHIRPLPGGGLSYARATYQSMYGEIVSSWKIANKEMTIEVNIPPNTTATLELPNALQDRVTEQGVRLGEAEGVRIIALHENRITLELESGFYQFQFEWRTSS